MSQKKHKKRHPQAKRRVSAPVEESEFASDGTRKRMNGTTRNILLFALILLAATEAMFRAGLLPEAVSNVVAIVGLVLLMIALWFQFGDPSGGSRTSSGRPKLKWRPDLAARRSRRFSMGKHHILPALALAGGLAGFGLRLWQRTSALDPVTELFASGAPASLALWGLMAALALAALLLSRGGAQPEQPEHAFLCPSAGYMTLMTAAGMCFLLAAALGVPELMEQIQTWQVDPVHHIMPAVFAVTVAACPVGAVGALVSGRNNYRGVTGLRTRIPAVLPACAALPWLMEVYQTYSRDPVLLRSSVPLLACVFLLLALYQQAAFFYQRPHPRRFILFAVLGMAFGGASLADGLSLFGAVLTAAFLLCTLGGLTALSYSRFAPGTAGRQAPDPTVR